MSFTDIPEELQGKTPAQLETLVKYLDDVCRSMVETDRGEIRSMSDVEQRAFDDGLALRNRAAEMIDEHNTVIETLRSKPQALEMFNINTDGDAYTDIRRLNDGQVRDRALRSLDDRMSTVHLSNPAKEEVERQVRKHADIARRVLVTETPEYRSAFVKLTTRSQPLLSPEEIQAVNAHDEYRAQSEGANGSGGYAIPVFIDPSIILTDQESNNPFLQIARQVTVNTNKWKGVSSAGVSWSFDDEAEAVSDDSLGSITQPSVDVFTARGYIPFSIEIGMDWPDFAGEMSRVLSAGYDELLVDKFSRGSGTGEPKGILTALDANTASEVVVGTDGALSDPDIYKVWKSLPQKYRRNASWMMSVDVNNKIRQFGTATLGHAFTVNLREEFSELLFRKPVYESPYFPDFTGTTGAANIAVVGDFSNYVIARNGGMSVELVPHVFDVTNNRPTGERGWFAYARIGGNSVNDAAFRLLQNQ